MLENMAECSRDAATELERILTNFHVDELGANMEKLHAIEHQGDTQRHNVVEKLVKEFITPIEREDIMELTDQIDDVTDAVEDVLLKIYMYNVRSISEDAIAFVRIVGKCCTELLHVFEEFESFKKPKTLHESIIELNRLEEEGDALYINAVRKLHVSQADAKEVAAWTEIYSRMEKVCDTCEHVADLVEHIIMKNT
jgi:predicted phosphate transport protein (TIGR00153 family)